MRIDATSSCGEMTSDRTITPPTAAAAVQRAIQAAGATLWYVPPYSPDLNPIELCFAKLKALVRTARCRRTETRWPFLGECLAHFSPDECRTYFRRGTDNCTSAARVAVRLLRAMYHTA